MNVEANSMQCDTPEALRFLASAAKTAEAHWMNAAADEIERLRLTDAEREAIVTALAFLREEADEPGVAQDAATLRNLLERTSVRT